MEASVVMPGNFQSTIYAHNIKKSLTKYQKVRSLNHLKFENNFEKLFIGSNINCLPSTSGIQAIFCCIKHMMTAPPSGKPQENSTVCLHTVVGRHGKPRLGESTLA